jgi:hypothetical protein
MLRFQELQNKVISYDDLGIHFLNNMIKSSKQDGLSLRLPRHLCGVAYFVRGHEFVSVS